MKYDDVMKLALERGFYFPSCEVYSDAQAGFWEYGPAGVSLKNKFLELWRRELVRRDRMIEIDGSQIMSKSVFEASGHLASFADPIVRCTKCKSTHRADKLIADITKTEIPESASLDEFDKVIAEKNTQASVVQELYAPKMPKQQAYLELLNTRIGENSKLDFTTLQIMDQSVVNFSTRSTYLAQDAKINWYLGLFGSMLSRYRIDYHLNGTGAVVNDAEVVFGNNDQSFDLNTIVNHNAQSTEGKVVEKSILKDTSKSLFKGMIRINEQAAHSNSFLSGRSILLSKGAKSDSIPGLEILTNDVKATHSASVAQMDDEQIFYLGTRCLSYSEAERIIVEGFLEPLSRTMSHQVRAWISNIIESKWANKELTINMDENLKAIVEVEETRYNENEEVEQHYKYR